MQELLKVDLNTQTVSARDLYENLGAKERFSVWSERLINYFGIEEMTSVFKPTEVNNNGGMQIRELQDYKITIETAKHICLMSRTQKGKECRQYLIDLEKAWNTPEQIFARALRIADETIKKLTFDVNRMMPKEIFADAVAASKTSILIGDLAKLICQNGYEIGQKRLFSWLRDNGYLIKEGASKNMPTQRYVEQGLFEVKESNIQNPDGSIRITKTTKVTGKGQIYFINHFIA